MPTVLVIYHAIWDTYGSSRMWRKMKIKGSPNKIGSLPLKLPTWHTHGDVATNMQTRHAAVSPLPTIALTWQAYAKPCEEELEVPLARNESEKNSSMVGGTTQPIPIKQIRALLMHWPMFYRTGSLATKPAKLTHGKTAKREGKRINQPNHKEAFVNSCFRYSKDHRMHPMTKLPNQSVHFYSPSCSLHSEKSFKVLRHIRVQLKTKEIVGLNLDPQSRSIMPCLQS